MQMTCDKACIEEVKDYIAGYKYGKNIVQDTSYKNANAEDVLKDISSIISYWE